MITKFIEASQPGKFNWGKFVVARFDEEEWSRRSHVMQEDQNPINASILFARGWNKNHIVVFDLETCEGAGFTPGGLASADLDKHKIWVCPLFEPFLAWLYMQDLTDLDKLPDFVELNAPGELFGYRREGK